MRLHFRTVHEFIEYTSFKGLAPDCLDSKLGCMLYNDSQTQYPYMERQRPTMKCSGAIASFTQV
jgi:hypothetical protein